MDRPADRHRLAHAFHRGGQFGLGTGKLLERETRDLGDHIVDGRLETGRGDPGDVVVEFVERIAHGEFRGDLGNRKARRLRRQRRRARDPRVHLDHHHAAGIGIDRPLHVRPARLDADLAQHREGGRAHALVFLVCERQRGRHGDRVARMHAHRVDVFDGAHDDRVVGAVAHDLHLELLPAEQRFVDQDLAHRRGVETGAAHRLEIVAVVGDAAAGAAQGKGRADDRGQADLFQRGPGVIHVAGDRGARVFQPDPRHRLAEQRPILGLFDRLAVGADHLHPVFGEHPRGIERQRGVEACLPAHGGQQRVGTFGRNDAGHHARGDRFDIGGIRQARIGHDGGGVRVHQDHPVPLFAQRLAGLGAGIVELAGLADHDGPCPDDQDRFDIGAFRHGSPGASVRAGVTLADCARSSGIGPVTAARCPAPPPTDRPHGGRPSHHGRRQARAARRIGWLPFRACSRILGLCTILRGSRCPERVIDRHRTRFARSGAT
jgi:hypothetical protein